MGDHGQNRRRQLIIIKIPHVKPIRRTTSRGNKKKDQLDCNRFFDTPLLLGEPLKSSSQLLVDNTLLSPVPSY